MPRETKSQRLAREAAERETRDAEAKATYPARLFAALERATNRNARFRFEKDDENNQYASVLFNSVCDYLDETYTVPFHWYGNDGCLWNLEHVLDSLDAADRERDRVAAIRAEALSKLSPEEREALGL